MKILIDFIQKAPDLFSKWLRIEKIGWLDLIVFFLLIITWLSIIIKFTFWA